MNTLRNKTIKKEYLDVFQINYEYIQQILQGPMQNSYCYIQQVIRVLLDIDVLI